MLSKKQNDLLSQVGPGTPMGDVMRRYWWPIMLSAELPEKDSDPMPVRLLGEDFIIFRDTNGRLGLMDEYCCHRGASLLVARVEECGIRCIFHGWKFDTDGNVLETPNAHAEQIAGKIRQPAYPVHEAAGLIWAYIGPAEHKPPFRRLHWMDLPQENIGLTGSIGYFNYLGMLEMGVDSSHVASLHRDSIMAQGAQGSVLDNGEPLHVPDHDKVPPRHGVEDTDFGFYYALSRDEPSWARVIALVMPTTLIIPPGFCTMITPVDDTTSLSFGVAFNRNGPVKPRRPMWETFPEICEQLPGRLLATTTMTRENRFKQDRASMKKGAWAGFPYLLAQEDRAITLALGPYPTREMEHLVAADVGTLRVRQQLLDLVRRVANGSPLRGVADVAGARDYEGPIKLGGDWRVLVPELKELANA